MCIKTAKVEASVTNIKESRTHSIYNSPKSVKCPLIVNICL